MAKVKKYVLGGLGGVIPELQDMLGPKNKGFAFGLIPGLIQRDRYADKMAEQAAKEAEAAAAPKTMKSGGSVKGWGAARGARKAKIY